MGTTVKTQMKCFMRGHFIKVKYIFFEIISCDPSISIEHPDIIACRFITNSIGLNGANICYKVCIVCYSYRDFFDEQYIV